MIGFNIEQAEDGGYFVAATRDPTRINMSYVKYAGTLELCIAYIEHKFLEEEKEREVRDNAIDIRPGGIVTTAAKKAKP
jgi:hypothetical protein